MLKQGVAACLAALMLAGCAAVTVRPDGGGRVAGAPDFQESRSYFLWGLIGEHTIDVAEICGKSGVEQFQSIFTFGDGLLGVVTLGLYTPKTAKVWCNLEGAAP